MSADATPYTTISVKHATLARLRTYKVGGASFEDVLNDLMDDSPPEPFIKECLRRLHEEPDIPWAEVRKSMRL